MGCENDKLRVVQEPGEAEEYFSQVDTRKLITSTFTSRSPEPPIKLFTSLPDPASLPCWLSEEDINYYAEKFNKKSFTAGLNYYRNMNL